MKRLSLIVFLGFLLVAMTSCTKNKTVNQMEETEVENTEAESTKEEESIELVDQIEQVPKGYVIRENTAHNMEIFEDKIYVKYQWTNPDDQEDWTDALWCFTPYEEAKIIAEGKGLDFRVSKNTDFIAVEIKGNIDFYNKKGEIVQSISSVDINTEDYTMVGLDSWNDDGDLLWCSLMEAYDTKAYVCINTNTWDLVKYNDRSFSSEEYVLNPNTGWIVYSDYPVMLDIDAFDKFYNSQQIVTLFLYNIISKEEIRIGEGQTNSFKPKWNNDHEIIYYIGEKLYSYELGRASGFMNFEELNALIDYSYEETICLGQCEAEEITEHLAAHRFNGSEDLVLSGDTNTLLDEKLIEGSSLSRLIESEWMAEDYDYSLMDNDMFRYYYLDTRNNMRVKVMNKKVFNLVLDQSYTEEVLEGISIGTSINDVILILGEPNFIDSDNAIIGYKNDDFYIFFDGLNTLNEVSIYRHDQLEEKDITELINHWELHDDDFLNLMSKYLPNYDFESGLSSSHLWGYESSGMIIKYDEASENVTIDGYGITSNITIKSDDDLEDIKVENHVNGDSIFDLERYRLLIEKKINGDQVGDQYFLGMAFQDDHNIIPLQDSSKSIYKKPATADDNYACIYIVDQSNYFENKELRIDPLGADVSWFSERYIISKGRDLSYIYDTINNNIITLPELINNKPYVIKDITEEGVGFVYEETISQ